MACLTEPNGRTRLASLYQAKILRKNLDSELKAWDATDLMKSLVSISRTSSTDFCIKMKFKSNFDLTQNFNKSQLNTDRIQFICMTKCAKKLLSSIPYQLQWFIIV